MSKLSNEFIIHTNDEDDDIYYFSSRNLEIILTLSNIYFELTNENLKISIINEESLKNYFTTRKIKQNDNQYTLMKISDNENLSLMDLLPKIEYMDYDKKEKTIDSNKIKEGEDNVININPAFSFVQKKFEKENYNNYNKIEIYYNVNPYSKSLKRGLAAVASGYLATTSGLGVFQATQSIPLGLFPILIGFPTLYFGLITSVESLFGFCIYKIYSLFQDKTNCKIFLDKFKNDKTMKVEREVYQYVITKMINYFTKYMSLKEYKKKEFGQIIDEILKSYFMIDINKIEKDLENFKTNYSQKFKFNIMLLGRKDIDKTKLITKILNLEEKNELLVGEKFKKNEGMNLWNIEGFDFSNNDNNSLENANK